MPRALTGIRDIFGVYGTPERLRDDTLLRALTGLRDILAVYGRPGQVTGEQSATGTHSDTGHLRGLRETGTATGRHSATGAHRAPGHLSGLREIGTGHGRTVCHGHSQGSGTSSGFTGDSARMRDGEPGTACGPDAAPRTRTGVPPRGPGAAPCQYGPIPRQKGKPPEVVSLMHCRLLG